MTEKTYLQLTAELAELDAKIATAWKRERDAVVQELRQFGNLGHCSERAGTIQARSYHTKPVKMKYRDPHTGREWSRRGHPPAWIEGKDRSRFLIVDERRRPERSSSRRDASQPPLSVSTTF